MGTICDKCEHGHGICPLINDLGSIMTENNRETIACAEYSLDPAIVLERDITRALQQLVAKGRIRTGSITRRKGEVLTITDPEIPDGEILAEMKHGHEMKPKDSYDE